MNNEFEDEVERTRERRSRKRVSGKDLAEAYAATAAAKQHTDGVVKHGRRTEEHQEESKASGKVTLPKHGADTEGAHVPPMEKSDSLVHRGANARQQARAARARKRKRMIIMIVAECFALLFIFSYAFAMKRWNMVQRPDFEEANVKNNDLSVDTVQKLQGYWTVAVFGVDARDKSISKGTNADVNIIANINRDTGEIRLLSVFRDSYLNIDDKGSYNKINQAYFVGGPEQAVKALNKNLDLDITNYITFNWKGVADAINILGGIDLEISKSEFYYINSFITETVEATGVGSHHLKKAGMNHLDGIQAVAYGRLRLMDNDFNRTARQRKVIALAFDKMKQADFGVLNNIMVTVFPNLASNIDLSDITDAALNISKYHLGANDGFPFDRGDANMGKKGACVIPQTLTSNVTKLHQFLFDDEDYSPSKSVLRISEKIAADTGMYKSQGSSSSSDKTSSSTKKTTEADEETTAKKTTAETDENGHTVKSTAETDENGRPVKTTAATDENGHAVKTTAETDENGHTVKTTAETDENGNTVKSTTAASGHVTNPTATTESTSAVHPGSTTETTASTPVTPGSTTATTAAGSNIYTTKPSETTSTGDGPGSSNTTSTTAASPSPVTETTAAASPVTPGGTANTDSSSGGPGSNAGTVAAVPGN